MVFISSFKHIAKSLKVRNDKIVIDNYLFRCHYKLTTNILLMFCILVTTNSFIGNSIECLTNPPKNADVQKVINTYCWVSSLFTDGSERMIMDGPPRNEKQKSKVIIFLSYYRWVPFMLFFQAITFYLPHWIWKMWEGEKIRMITMNVREFHMDTAKHCKEGRLEQNKLVQYFIKSLHTHRTYAVGYVSCEIFNIINIIANIYITNKFLGGKFLTYGIEIFHYQQNRNNLTNLLSPMESIFPRITKCDFKKYGPSGSIQNIDTLCVLAQNVLNDKIYLFLWIWFGILAILSVLALINRVFIIAQVTMKKTVLFNTFNFTTNTKTMSTLTKKFQMGDLLLLYFIQKNVNSVQFKEIMEEICSNLNIEATQTHNN